MKTKQSGGLLLGALLSLAYFTCYMTRYNYTAVIAQLTAADGGIMTKAQAGMIGTAFFITYGVGQLVSGYFSDKFRPERLMMLGFALTVGCSIAMPMIPNPSIMTVIWAVNGFALSLFWPPIIKLMAAYYTDADYARCSWCLCSICQAAIMLTYLVAATCLHFADWKMLFYITSALAIFFAILFSVGFVTFRKNHPMPPAPAVRATEKTESTPEQTARPSAQKRVKSVYLTSGLIPLMIPILLMGFLKDGVQLWLPNFFTEAFGLSASSAVLLNAAVPAFSILAIGLATILYRKVFRNEALGALVFFCVILLGSGLLTCFMGYSSQACLLFALMITGGAYGTDFLLVCLVPRRFAEYGRAGLISGVLNFCVYVGSAVSSFGIAIIADHFGWRATLLSWCGVALAGGVLCALLLPRWRRFIQQKNDTPCETLREENNT